MEITNSMECDKIDSRASRRSPDDLASVAWRD
jgi:hypothetical protein